MSDLFAAGHEDYQPGAPGSSPKKVGRDNVVAPKGAGQQKFQQSRIFAEEEPTKEAHIYKTNPARYNHFDIGDADENDTFQHHDPNAKVKAIRGDMPQRSSNQNRNQHASQWSFEDFVTPEKVKQKTRDQDVVHFSVGDENSQPESQHQQQQQQHNKARKDAEAHFEFQDNGTPVHRPAVPKPRKDANAHFDFTDEPTPAPRRMIARTKAAEKLYADPVFDVEEERPLATVSHNARKGLGTQLDPTDDSQKPHKGNTGRQQARPGSRRENDKSSFWDF